MILNAVGRLSNLYLFTGTNDWIDCFNPAGSCGFLGVLGLGLWETELANCLFLSTAVSACEDDIPISASDDWGEASLATSDAMLVLGLLAGCSVTASPLGPVACEYLEFIWWEGMTLIQETRW